MNCRIILNAPTGFFVRISIGKLIMHEDDPIRIERGKRCSEHYIQLI